MLAPLPRYIGFVAALVLLVTGGCQTGGGNGFSFGGGSSGDAHKEISALIDQYNEALLKKDTAALDRIWADDLSFINLRGELLTKQNRMENVRTGATAFKSIKFSEQQTRTYGQVAVVTCRVVLEAQYSGQEGSGDYRVTFVCTRPKGTWQFAAIQMTRIG